MPQVDDQERPGRELSGWTNRVVAAVAFAVAVLTIWQVFRPLPQGSQFYLIVFLAGSLPLVYLVYRSGWGRLDPDDRPGVLDWVLAAITLVVCLYPILPVSIGSGGGGYNAFLDRQGLLEPTDVVMGALLLVLVLEACRRTTGWALPIVCGLFLAYGYYGGLLPQGWAIAHAGLDFDQIVDALYNSGSGFFGTPLDVAATYIVLFTIYGAVLELSGGARFFVDLSVATFRRSRSAAGRTAVASGFLLGTVSGSGTATAVSVGAVTWPIMRRAGYTPERAGGVLAAAGVGALLSPPTLGAAAFIVAEYLEVSYLTVLGWAMIPTVLYYLGILLAVEIDARRFGMHAANLDTESPWKLLGRFGYHFSSLIVDRRAAGPRDVCDPGRCLRHGSRLPAVFPGPLWPAHTASTLRRAQCRRPGRAAGRRRVRRRRGDHGDDDQDRSGRAVFVRAGRWSRRDHRQPHGDAGADGRLRRGRTGDARARDTGDRVVRHRLGHHRPGTACARRPRACRRHVRLLLLGALRGHATDGVGGRRRVGGHRRAGDPDDVEDAAVRRARIPGADRVRADRPWRVSLGRGPVLGVLWASAAACVGIVALSFAAGGWVLGVGAAGPIPRVLAGAAALLLLFLDPVTIAAGSACLLVAVAFTIIDKRRRT